MAFDAAAVWARLVAGAPLDGLGLAPVDGRWDLRGFRREPAQTGPVRRTAGYDLVAVAPSNGLRRVSLVGLDLSKARLPDRLMTQVEIRDCVFDLADLSGLRMWETKVVDSSFRSAKLRDASMGGNPLHFWHRRHSHSIQRSEA